MDPPSAHLTKKTVMDDDNDLDLEVGVSVKAKKKTKTTIGKKKKKDSFVDVPLDHDGSETELSNEERSKTVILSSSEDPFTKRTGKALIWRDMQMSLKTKGKDGTIGSRKLLTDVWGEIPSGMTTAVMGPSGAGKTSLLNILAGRATTRGAIEIHSDVRLNNYAVDPTSIETRKMIAFVAQDDSLQPTSTPREAIYFSAKLRLPKTTPEDHLHSLTDRMLEELGLVDCADTIVGGPLLKGISGGQRKRTSVGVELVTRPALVFLDEPTSGLDSFSAVQLCQVLKKVANSGASVLFTIHQPSSEIFNAFDRLILMNQGRVMFQGPTDHIASYFKKRGHKIPKKYNPADFVMNVAQAHSMEELEKDGFFSQDKRRLPAPFIGGSDGKDELGITITGRHDMNDKSQPGMTTQVKMLFAREVRNMTRDKSVLGGRFAFTGILGILIGIIFLGVGEEPSDNASNLNGHFGALLMVMLMGMFGTAQQALLAFPQERPVFLREYSTNHYSVFSYFINRLTVEAVTTAAQIFILVMITFWLVGFQSGFGIFYLNVYALAMASTALSVALGCAVEDPKLGQEMLPILFVPQLLFAGFFVAPDLIPVWLRWLQWVFPLTYSVKIGVVEEFGNGCGGGQGDVNCANLIDGLNADQDDVWWYWLVVVLVFSFFRILALIILRRKATKFF